MSNFYGVQVTRLNEVQPCYWCDLERSTVRATHLVTRTSNLTHHSYSDAACERHVRPWRRTAALQAGQGRRFVPARPRPVQRV